MASFLDFAVPVPVDLCICTTRAQATWAAWAYIGARDGVPGYIGECNPTCTLARRCPVAWRVVHVATCPGLYDAHCGTIKEFLNGALQSKTTIRVIKCCNKITKK